MNSLYHCFPLLFISDELDRAIAVALAVVAAAIFYRFFENLFDVFGAGGRVRRFFISDWGSFEDTLDRFKIGPDIRNLLRTWALENHPHDPMDVLENRLFFEHWVTQFVERPGFAEHSHSDRWLRQMRALREGLELFPAAEDQVISSRELQVGSLLRLSQTHPDLESQTENDGVTVKIEVMNDLSIQARFADVEASLNRGEYWVRCSHDGDWYRFQSFLSTNQRGLVSLSHGRFLIREKRSNHRIKYIKNIGIHWNDATDSREQKARCLDLSRTGIALATESLIPLKTTITFDLPIPGLGKLQELRADILDVTPYAHGLVRLHCQFSSLDCNELKTLEDFIQKVRKSNASLEVSQTSR